MSALKKVFIGSLLGLAASPAIAGMIGWEVIDDFTVVQDNGFGGPISSGGAPGVVQYYDVSGPVQNLMGGHRDTVFSMGGAGGSYSFQVGVNPLFVDIGGETALGIATNGTVTTSIVWDGTHVLSAGSPNVDVNGLNQDLSILNDLYHDGLLLDVVSTDQLVTVAFTAWSDSGANRGTASYSFPSSATSTNHFFRLEDFTETPLGAGIDWDHVSALRMDVTGAASWDATFSIVAATHIPAPGVIGLLGIGLLGIGASRRRRA